MPTLYTNKDSNIRKTWLLISFFTLFIIGVGYVFSYAYNNPGILIFAVGFSVFSSFFSYWYSDKIVLLMSKARLVTREQGKELYNIVENLCITAGLPVPKIYIIDDTAPNAFATGRNPQHAVVAVTTGILQKLDRVELEGVIAHELSHIGNRDILLSTIVAVLVGSVVLISDWFLRWTWWGGGRRGRDNEGGSGQIQMIIFLIAIVLAILAPLVATIIQLAISRKREFLADASGALLTRYPEGLASALKKISADQEPLEVANKATAHLYIVNPLKGKSAKNWLAKLFTTHPPVEERIKALRGQKI